MEKKAGHGPPPASEGPVTRLSGVGALDLLVITLGQAPSKEQASWQGDCSQHRGREQHLRRGMGSVPLRLLWLLPTAHLDSFWVGILGD